MSTQEEREDDARREPIIEQIRDAYDAAATEIAAFICRKRHAPVYGEIAMSYRQSPIDGAPDWDHGWTPHPPGRCEMAQQIENALWLAKDPPGYHMTNPPRVYADQMDAFITRVSERTGVDFSEGRR